ncbi:aminotransferase class III-fold pyridoxal phosphate-dependent enzyme [Candidatus Woesearchaeota archaeon]|nr:aminotransferase class III-fold pyridoxal phosphate-dependent enzyme [Candidatus Woesearchaeota archaeon]
MILQRNLNKELPVAVYYEGIYIQDNKGKKYLDAGGNACAISIGHNNQYVINAIEKQLKLLSFAHTASFNNEPAIKLAKSLENFCGGNLKYCFFSCNGSDAVESAIKLAHQYHSENGYKDKKIVIGKKISYHGNTIECLKASGFNKRRDLYSKKFEGLEFKLDHVSLYRSEQPKEEIKNALKKAEDFLKIYHNLTSAIIIEPISGASGGANPFPYDYIEEIFHICRKYNILLIIDEVMSGMGRTGQKFAYQNYDIKPDIVVTAKGLSNGTLPLSALICTEKIHETIKNGSGELVNGFTWSGHALSCAAGLAVMEYIENNNLVKNCEKMGVYLKKQLKQLYKYPFVGDVRGKGLLLGLEFVKDKKTKTPFDAKEKFCYKLKQKCMNNGLLIYPSQGCIDGYSGDCMLIAPPYIINEQDADKIVELLDQSFKEIN